MKPETRGNMSGNHLTTCPICEYDCGHETTVREHLMVRHRKSTVADELLEIAQNSG
jgi:hypothetical protein